MNSSDHHILVLGGAGYIGSHTVKLLTNSGFKITVLDNLSFGHVEAIDTEVINFVEGDLGDTQLLTTLFEAHRFTAVVHFAAFAFVGESVVEPAKYYDNNIAKPLRLLDVMRKFDCKKFIFSSTCASYGNPQYVPIDEKHPQAPINPYGNSKLMLEMILKDYEKAYGIKHVILRYFNASGAATDGSIGEDHDPETHLIPLVLEAAVGEREHITVFGTDYDTPDGSCIRDYIHVNDLGRAHILGLEKLIKGDESVICNLGTGVGVSVKEIIKVVEEVTGKTVPVSYGDRRPGDPSELVADPSYALEQLGWKAEFMDIKDTISSAWLWKSGPRNGHY